MAYEASVLIAMGSDVGTPLNYHGENALEVYWMEQAGMSKLDALVQQRVTQHAHLAGTGGLGLSKKARSRT